MRKFPFQIEADLQFTPQKDPWRRRMPTQVYIARDLPRRAGPPARPAPFGKRSDRPTSVMRMRRFSLSRLASLFQGPRKTTRTNAR